MQDDQRVDFLDQDEPRQFLRKNADYYRAKWGHAVAKAGSLEAVLQKKNFMSWNWAGFFLTWAWLMYRKMYLYGFLVAGLAVGLVIAEQLTGKPLTGAVIGLSMAVGLFGNCWYLLHTHKRVEAIKATTADAEARRVLLTAAGGTNVLAAVAAPVLAVAIVAAAAFAPTLELPAMNPAEVASSEPAALPHYSEELQEISAWWQADEERVGIFVAPSRMGLYFQGKVNISDRGLISGTDDQFKTLRVVQVDPDNDSWSFELDGSPGKIWTVRKTWNEARDQFRLQVFTPNSESVDLGFVRRFTPEEVQALSKPAPTEPQAASVAASPAGATDYSYLHPDISGVARVSQRADGMYDVEIQSASLKTGAICKVQMRGAKSNIIPTQPDRRYLSWQDSEAVYCPIVMWTEGQRLEVDGNFEPCRRYCEDGGEFFGEYEVRQ